MTKRRLLLALAILAVGAFWLSRQNADRFAPSIASAIEGGLGRKVEINGPVRFLPWRLGFSLEQVVIRDDPRFGLEQLAYVQDLQATVRLLSLLSGRLEFDKLRLVDPSVNLAQGPNGWNFPALLEAALSPDKGVAPPEVEVTGGRLNIRFGETKSVYHLRDADFTLEPGGSPDQLSLYFDGVPARTDRGGRSSFGRLSGRGTVKLSGARDVNVQVTLERSAASELLLLFQDHGSSVKGFFSGNAKLAGPLDDLKIDGRLQLHEFERLPWLTGNGNRPGVDFGGTLNWGAQSLRIETKSDKLPVQLHVTGQHLLGSAEWRTRALIADAPAEALGQLASQFGLELPGGSQLTGKLAGEVIYETKAGATGQIDFSGGSLVLREAMAEVEPASLKFAGRKATVGPVVVQQGAQTVKIDATYDWSAAASGLSWSFTGPQLDITQAREWGLALPGHIEGGTWMGALRYEAATGGWQGEGDLTNAALAVEGLQAKVALDSAHVKLQGTRFALTKMTGSADAVPFRGEFQYDPDAAIQSQLQIQVTEEVTPTQLRTWLAPAFQREAGLLNRTFGLGTTTGPDWVASRRMNAQLQLKALRLSPQTTLSPIAIRAAWSGGILKLTGTGPARMRVQGDVVLSSSNNAESKITINSLPWRGGTADAEFTFDALRTPGRMRMSATASNVTLLDGEPWPMLQADATLDLRSDVPKADFTRIEAGTQTGTGQSLPSGDWEWTFKMPTNRKITGPIWEGAWK